MTYQQVGIAECVYHDDFFVTKVAEFGMSPVIGNVSFPQTSPHEPAKRFYSDKLVNMIDEVCGAPSPSLQFRPLFHRKLES